MDANINELVKTLICGLSETNRPLTHINPGVSPQVLETALRDLPRIGTLIKDRDYRQVWRFELEGQAFYLKFYPRAAMPWKRVVRGSSARREFVRLQALQKAKVSAPRAIALLMGFRLNDRIGDAVILKAIEPSITLDGYVANFRLRGQPIPNHHALLRKILDLLAQLGKARLGHGDLHLGNLLLHGEQIFLLDAHAVRFGGLKTDDVMLLAHSARGIATRTDLQRGWDTLSAGGLLPRHNPVSRRQWRKLSQLTRGENLYFGRAAFGDWRGIYSKLFKFPKRWAPASSLIIELADWEKAWPILWRQIENNQLRPIKRSPSGDVWEGEVNLAGRTVEVIIKRPYKRYWYRYLNEIGRGSRAWRAWQKAWTLIWRDLPTAWPLLVLQKRTMGYITDAVLVLERVRGSTLAAADLNVIPGAERETLFRRAGSMLRQIDDLGLSHFDAKASNWIVQQDARTGPRPILIDVDGIRFRRWRALGIERLLRSMRDHPQYAPGDSLALCQGYAPFSPVSLDQATLEEEVEGDDDTVTEEDEEAAANLEAGRDGASSGDDNPAA